MQLKFFILLCLCLNLQTLMSQNVPTDSTLMPLVSIKVPYFEGLRILENDEKKVWLINDINMLNKSVIGDIKTRKPVLYLYDKSSKTLTYQAINVKVDNKKMNYVDCLIIDGKIHIILAFENRKQKTIYFFADTYNADNLQSENNLKMIAEIDLSREKRGLFGFLDDRFSFGKEKDGNGYYIHSFIPTGNQYEENFILFDDNLQKITTHRLTSTQPNELLEPAFDKKGNLYLFEKEGDKSPTVYLTCFRSETDEPIRQEIACADMHIQDYKLHFDNAGNPIFLCAIASADNEAKGFMTQKFEPELKAVEKPHMVLLDKEFMTSALDKEKNKWLNKLAGTGEAEADIFISLTQYHANPDDTFYTIYEKQQAFEISSNRLGTSYYKNFSDLYINLCGSDGAILWTSKIVKEQSQMGLLRRTGGFFADFSGADNGIRVIYNNEKEKTKWLSCTHIDKQGVVSESSLNVDKSWLTFMLPAYAFRGAKSPSTLLTFLPKLPPVWAIPSKNRIEIAELKTD